VIAAATSVKVPSPIDRHVGGRMIIGLTQEKLGDALGLTFQQVQKYEKGTNRIGASRLQQLAEILQVPVAFFFEGLPGANGQHPAADDFTAVFLTMSEGLELARAFVAIENSGLRRALVKLAQEAAAAP
jgi:transcriptional regulator with XRE-family HTH domain